MRMRDLADHDRQLDALDPDGSHARRGLASAARGYLAKLDEVDALLGGAPERSDVRTVEDAASAADASRDATDDALEDLFDDAPAEIAEAVPLELGEAATGGSGAVTVARVAGGAGSNASLFADLASVLEPESEPRDAASAGDDSEPTIDTDEDAAVELDADELAALDSLEILIDD